MTCTKCTKIKVCRFHDKLKNFTKALIPHMRPINQGLLDALEIHIGSRCIYYREKDND